MTGCSRSAPGSGSLTLALAETGARVVAVETDRHLVPVLRSVVEPAGVDVVEGDALTLDLAALLADRGDAAVEPGGQPALQRGHAARPADPDRSARGDAPTRHGAARGGGADGGGGGRRRPTAPSPSGSRISPRAEVVGRRPGVGVHAAARGSNRCWCASCAGPSRPSTRRSCPTSGSTPWCGPASASAARCCGGRWRAWSSPDAFARAGVRPEARAEELDVAAWGRLAASLRALGPGQAHGDPRRDRRPRATATTSSTPRWSR